MKIDIDFLRSKLAETRREREAQELAHAQSSDWHSPPSMRVARLEGQESILEWLISLEGQVCQVVDAMKLEIDEHKHNG